MTLKEFQDRCGQDPEWAPGWEAIDRRFEALYPGQDPAHYASVSRAIFGGNQFLDGISIYRSPKGFLHLVSYGMSELYQDEESLGGEWSKWGYEMTFKLPGDDPKEAGWAMDILSNLARYTFTQGRFFEPMQFIANQGQPIKAGSDTALTGMLVVPDTEVQGVDTIYGRLDFLQLVGITGRELDALMADHTLAPELAERMQVDNPLLLTDLSRTKSYL